MSPRPKVIRKINAREIPEGLRAAREDCGDSRCIILLFEEYEAIRLCDHEAMTQEQAAGMMGISRPTLTRIYASARKKLADALVSQKNLKVSGGKAFREASWYRCLACGLEFNEIRPERPGKRQSCPICGATGLRYMPDNGKTVLEEGNETYSHKNKNTVGNMEKIVLPAREGRIDDHFGHCDYYVIYTVEDGKITRREEMPSPQGCGCKSGIAAEFQKAGISVMLAGNMGAGALNKLTAHGIKVIRGCSGKLEDVLAAYLEGSLHDSGEGCSHHECADEEDKCSHEEKGNDNWHIA